MLIPPRAALSTTHSHLSSDRPWEHRIKKAREALGGGRGVEGDGGCTRNTLLEQGDRRISDKRRGERRGDGRKQGREHLLSFLSSAPN